MADGSLKKCPNCRGTGECPECRGLGGVEHECPDCGQMHEGECWECDNTGKCTTCEGRGRLPKTDGDLEREGQLNLLQERSA